MKNRNQITISTQIGETWVSVPAFTTVRGLAIGKTIKERDGLYKLTSELAIYDIKTGLIAARNGKDSISYFECKTPASLLNEFRKRFNSERLDDARKGKQAAQKPKHEALGKLAKPKAAKREPAKLSAEYSALQKLVDELNLAILSAPKKGDSARTYLTFKIGAVTYKLLNYKEALSDFKGRMLKKKSVFSNTALGLNAPAKPIKTKAQKPVLKVVKQADKADIITATPVKLPSIKPLPIECTKALAKTIKRNQERLNAVLIGEYVPKGIKNFFTKNGLVLISQNGYKLSSQGLEMLSLQPVIINRMAA